MIDQTKLDMATEAYLNNDSFTASQIYDDILDEDSNASHNPYLLINSGISDYKAQKIGLALSKLYQAKKILPRNKALQDNIEIIENEIQLNNPKIFSLNFINFPEALILLLVFNLLFIFKSRISKNKIWQFLIVVSFFLSLMLAGITYIEQGLTKYAFVTSITADTYTGNNTAYSKLYELLDGQMIKLVRKEDTWSQIKYNDSLCWIENDKFHS